MDDFEEIEFETVPVMRLQDGDILLLKGIRFGIADRDALRSAIDTTGIEVSVWVVPEDAEVSVLRSPHV